METSIPPSLPVTLRPKRSKLILLFFLSLLFVVGGIFMVRDGDSMGYFCGGFFALGLPIFAIQLHPKAAYLRLSLDGFTFCSLFRAHTVQWADVQKFGVIQMKTKSVGWNFVPNYKAAWRGRRLAKTLTGYEAGLPDTYGMKAQELADLLNKLRAIANG